MEFGKDEKDSTTVDVEKVDYTKSLINNVKGIRIGIPKEYLAEGVNSEVKEAILNVAKKYEELGAIVEDCSFNFGSASRIAIEELNKILKIKENKE